MNLENKKNTTSFGRYLQAARMKAGMSLEAVAKETRIRLDTLEQIEEENHENLPDEVFVRGFLRAYAGAVGADGTVAVSKYNSRMTVISKLAKSESELMKSGSRIWLRLFVSLVALLCLIAGTIWVSQLKRESKPEVASEETTEPQTEAEPQVDAPVADTMPEVQAEDVLKAVEKHLLRIETSEETWLKIIIDGQEPNEYKLFPGDRVELEAKDSYNLLIGNSGGVDLFLNDQPVAIAGKSGQVINIQLP